MAIKILVTKEKNKLLADFPDAYCIIRQCIVSNGNANVELAYYVNEEAREEHKRILDAQLQMSPTTPPMPMMPPMIMEPFITNMNINIPTTELNNIGFDSSNMSLDDVNKKACYLHLMNSDEFVNGVAV